MAFRNRSSSDQTHMIPHRWILKSLEIFGVVESSISMIRKSMNHWKVYLSSGKRQELGEVKVKRQISRKTVFRHYYS